MSNQRFRRPVNMAPARPAQNAVQTALSRYFAQDFFTYVIPITTALAAGSSTEGNVTLDADADFLWQKFTAYADIDDAGQTLTTGVIPGCTVVITDTGSGRNLSNTGVPIPALCGTGALPFIMPTPKIFKASGQIQVQVANITDDQSYSSIYLVFIGQKCYLKGSQ